VSTVPVQTIGADVPPLFIVNGMLKIVLLVKPVIDSLVNAICI